MESIIQHLKKKKQLGKEVKPCKVVWKYAKTPNTKACGAYLEKHGHHFIQHCTWRWSKKWAHQIQVGDSHLEFICEAYLAHRIINKILISSPVLFFVFWFPRWLKNSEIRGFHYEESNSKTMTRKRQQRYTHSFSNSPQLYVKKERLI